VGLGWRVAATLVLLVVFPALMVVLLGLLLVVEVAAFHQSAVVGVKLGIFVVPAGLVVLRGLGTLVARIEVPDAGVPLTESAQPELWRLVRRLAEVAGTRPPDKIFLIADVNAAVLEETRVLGLISRDRRMFIGAPLLAGMREDQLAAVLTHELAHYGNRDTRLSGLVYRVDGRCCTRRPI
jgi:Zn-dependent protease with chaperone function